VFTARYETYIIQANLRVWELTRLGTHYAGSPSSIELHNYHKFLEAKEITGISTGYEPAKLSYKWLDPFKLHVYQAIYVTCNTRSPNTGTESFTEKEKRKLELHAFRLLECRWDMSHILDQDFVYDDLAVTGLTLTLSPWNSSELPIHPWTWLLADQ